MSENISVEICTALLSVLFGEKVNLTPRQLYELESVGEFWIIQFLLYSLPSHWLTICFNAISRPCQWNASLLQLTWIQYINVSIASVDQLSSKLLKGSILGDIYFCMFVCAPAPLSFHESKYMSDLSALGLFIGVNLPAKRSRDQIHILCKSSKCSNLLWYFSSSCIEFLYLRISTSFHFCSINTDYLISYPEG